MCVTAEKALVKNIACGAMKITEKEIVLCRHGYKCLGSLKRQFQTCYHGKGDYLNYLEKKK